jgi:hypothetical protein
MNRHQPVRHFDGMTGLPGIPVHPRAFSDLPSETTAMSIWRGDAALLSAGHAAGLERLLARLGPHARRGSARAREVAESLVAGFLKDEQIGARVPPFDCALFLVGVNREFRGTKEDRRDLWAQLAAKLVGMQNTDGSWDKKYPRVFLLPTSLRARLDSTDPVLRRTPDAPPRSFAHTLLTWSEKHEPAWQYHCHGRRSPLRRSKRPHTAGHYTFDRVIQATACAALFLARDVRPPVAGDCAWSGSASAGLLSEVLEQMREKCGVPFAYRPVGSDLPRADVLTLPALVLRGAGAFEPQGAAKETLNAYMENGGLVLVAPGLGKAGSEFAASAREALQGMVPGGAVRAIGEDKDLLAEVAGKVKLEAVVTPKGAPAVVFLPAGQGPAAASAVCELLVRRVPADILKESYPIALGDP